METMALSTHQVFLRNVRRRLRELEMTQAQLAQALGLSEPYVSQILRGRCVPSIDLPDRMAPALKTTPLYLVTPVDPEPLPENLESGIDATLQIR
jgi:transcriptional regulator with XRE-family HTH domain